MPKISILVPIYNVEKYLRQCLESLINQSFEDLEIICINDGSTDSSKQIVDEYRFRDKRIKLINKTNSGYGDSMNMGLEAATGDYIGIIEPDDFTEHCMYEDLYKIAYQNPEINLIKSDWYLYSTNNNQSRKAGKIKKDGIVNIRDYQKLLKYQSIWTCLFKREFLNKYNIRFLTTPGASYQDTSFAFKTFALAGNVYLTTKAYVHYRTDNDNSSVKSKEKVYYICNEHEEIAKFLDSNCEIKQDLLASQRINQYRAYKWNAARIDKSLKIEFLKRFQETFKNYAKENSIPKEFFKKVRKNEFDTLLSDLNSYSEFINKIAKRKYKHSDRNKKFSVRINRSRISIILFGRQVVEIE